MIKTDYYKIKNFNNMYSIYYTPFLFLLNNVRNKCLKFKGKRCLN